MRQRSDISTISSESMRPGILIVADHVRPLPAAVFDFPTVISCLKKSNCPQVKWRISEFRIAVFKAIIWPKPQKRDQVEC